MSRTTMDLFILLTVFQLMSSNEAFNFSCPSQAHWTLLSKSMCIPARYYTCLYDVTLQVNAYRHRCSRPRSLEAGHKYVFQPNLNKAACSITRYQPLFFDTVGNSDCVFLKSVCNSEGQKTDGKGNTISDRTCICNIYNGYTFVEDKGNRSTCNPSVEDCSCYVGIHPKNRTICSKDMKCSVEIELMPGSSPEERINISSKIIEFDSYKYNVVYLTNGYRTKAAVPVFMLLVFLVAGGAYIQRKRIITPIVIVGAYNQRKRTNTPSEPRVPFGLMVTNWSDASITISWNWKKYEKKQSGFIVKYRHKGTGWVSEVTAVPCKKFEHTLQGLRPETLYEIKVTSRNRNIRSKFSTALNQCTRKAAPTRFDITGCSHCSITVEWYNKDPNDHQYELVYRQESKDWVVLTLSKLEIQADEIGHYKYTLQNLLPEAGYEMKLCSITNNIKSQYSDSKRKDTLKLVLPEAISRLPEDDRTKYTNLLQSSKTEKRFYVRTIIVGKHRIGKTCLLRRLLKEDISDVVSTDGIDILLRRCKINIEDGKWIIDKEFKDDRGDRIQRAVMEMQNKKHEIGNRIVVKANHKQPKVKNSKPSDNESKENNDVSQLATLDEQKKYKNSEIYSVKNDELNPNVPDNHIPPGKKTDTEDGREIVVPFDLKSNSPVVEKAKKDTTSDQNARYHDKFSINDHTKSKDTDSRSNVNTMKSDSNAMDIEIDEANENVTPTSLVIPQDLMSHVFSEKTSNISPSNLYAFCELWDFAGQKEFYATHQAFLSSSAIYLVVADMADDINQQDIKQHFAEYGDVGGYVDFWFNSIHCHRTMKSPPKDPLNSSCDPPILLVFTGKDKYNEVQFVERKRKLNKQLDDVFGLQSKYHHLRYTFYLSNTTDSDEKFDELRNAISATAKEMNNWGESLPLKWILLEHLTGINKDAGKNFINLTDMMSLAKHSDININDINELFLFLRFQHEVGNIIFFHNIQDLIILNPKWLIDALRCLVSDRYDSAIQHTSDWTQFARYGKLSESLVSKLFQSKPGSQFSGQKGNLCQIMEKLDILVKIEDMRYYIMPSMMPSSTFEKVCENMGIRKSNCKRTSWFCLKFEFLPPSFYNHFSSWFIKNYNPSKIKIGKKKENSDKESLALYRGICMFDIDSSGCEKILVTMSTDTIALQILSFSEKKKKFSMCSIFRRELLTRVKHLSDRYNVQVCFDLHFKCNTGDYNADTKSYADLKSTPEYYCTQHQAVHRSEVIYLPWMCKEDELSEDVVNYLRLVALLHVAEDAVRLVFNDEFSRSRISRWISENFCQLTTLYRQKVLLEHQWNFLRSCMQRKDIDSSEQFDLHLMLCLLKNFTQLDICNNPRILVNSLDVSECLSTIWYYRTQVNHNVNGTIPNINFQEDLVKISQAIESLSKPRDGLLVFKCQKLQKCRLDDKNEISKEESNYLRIVHFITHVATKVVRKCFDVEFSDSLHDALKQRYSQIEGIRKWIGDQQFAMLYPTKGEVSSCTLDIRTMAILMKYLKGIHLDRFLSDIDPNSNYCADLSRLW